MKTLPAAYWSIPTQELFTDLQSGKDGLSAGEAETRLAQYGPNEIQSKHKATGLQIFLNQFKSPIILMLLFATLLSAFLQDWTDAVIILLIIGGSAALSFVQEYRANNAAEELRQQVTARAVVLRAGQPETLPARQVVPGDVVLLSAGSLVPADGIVLHGRDLFLSQSVLTGETFPVEKKPGSLPAQASLAERTNCVFMGTNVRSGSGALLVVHTGSASEFGQIAGRLALRPAETEFERGVRRFGYLLSEVTLLMVIAVFAFNVLLHKPVLDSLLFSMALAVGLTPQLLPAIININLSKGSRAMAASGVIVRRLEAIENFGSMDVLCTDKTGTLTEGIVKLDGALDARGQPSPLVLRQAYLNAHFQTGLANPLDEAIIATAGEPDIHTVTKIDEVPYDFVRKRLSVVVSEDGVCTLIAKGALDNILEVSTLVQQDEGAARPFEASDRARIKEAYTGWSAQGYRVLGVACKTVEQLAVYSRSDETDLTFCGFLIFFDPPKPGVQDVLADLQTLGITLKMITGDNRLVAQHAARAVGMPDCNALTGAELNAMRDEALLHAVEGTCVFAEVDPNQKERIITALRKRGHVVGYMGDGINDAPSLHNADVGISVDTAVDVAKEAADFVLLKKDLAVLHQGILQGRTTFANTLKYVFMATSANFGNMFSVAGASLMLPFLPMLPKQILLINFLTDLPEMAIANDNVDPEWIEKPRRWDVAYIRRFMLRFGLLSSLFDYASFGVLLLLLGVGWSFLPQDEALFHSGWFVESVVSAALVVFAVRTRLPFFKSKPGKMMLVLTALVVLVTIAIPFSPAAVLLGFSPLPPVYLLAMLGVALIYFICAEAVKRQFYGKEMG